MQSHIRQRNVQINYFSIDDDKSKRNKTLTADDVLCFTMKYGGAGIVWLGTVRLTPMALDWAGLTGADIAIWSLAADDVDC